MNNYKLNRKTHLTRVDFDGKQAAFLLTKVLIPAHIYFNNNQSEIVTNTRTFGIEPQKVKEGKDGVKFTKKAGYVIITVAVWNAFKPLSVQFLIKSGLSMPDVHKMIAEDKFSRFAPMARYLEYGVMLATEIKADKLMDLLKQIEQLPESTEVEGVEKTEEPQKDTSTPKKVAVKKPRGVGKTQTDVQEWKEAENG